MRVCLIFCLTLMVGTTAVANSEADTDPFEDWNRAVFAFNQRADQYVIKPLAEGYEAVTPTPVEKGVRNFFNNLGEPVTIVNAVLQGKPEKAARSLTRFVFNSTIGVYGLIDVAGGMGLERENEDFSQTLAVWGVGSGPYLVLPIVGPSDVRGLTGRVADTPLNPVEWQDDVGATELFVVDGVQTRAGFLGVEPDAAGDPYVLMRSAYQQRRDYEINDGIAVDLFMDDPFLEDLDSTQ
jgi:phospholipid-binding lipoprotein MlaA